MNKHLDETVRYRRKNVKRRYIIQHEAHRMANILIADEEEKRPDIQNHRFQLIFYGQLIQDNFKVPVNRGFIVYTRSKNKLVEVPIREKDYEELEKGAYIAIGPQKIR
jgi:CRISPR/Cas system-associated exonuclease Cas4 (RecB family)